MSEASSHLGKPSPPPAIAAPADKRPWGLWASLVWYLIIFEGVERLFDYALNRTGLQAIADHNHALSSLP